MQLRLFPENNDGVLCVFLTYSSNIFMDKFAENAPR